MDCSLTSSSLFVQAEPSGNSLCIPGWGVSTAWQQAKEFANIRIGSGVCLLNRVVSVPGILMPGIEDDLFIGVVWMNREDNSFNRVITKDRAHSDLHTELELVTLRR